MYITVVRLVHHLPVCISAAVHRLQAVSHRSAVTWYSGREVREYCNNIPARAAYLFQVVCLPALNYSPKLYEYIYHILIVVMIHCSSEQRRLGQ